MQPFIAHAIEQAVASAVANLELTVINPPPPPPPPHALLEQNTAVMEQNGVLKKQNDERPSTSR